MCSRRDRRHVTIQANGFHYVSPWCPPHLLRVDFSNHQRPHSISLSARSTKPGGMVWLIAFAVLRLIESLKVVGCSIGNSAGFVPRRTLSNILAKGVKEARAIAQQSALIRR